MPQYRTKPLVIEAFQMTEERREDNQDWPGWLNEAWNTNRKEVGSVYQWVSKSIAEKAGMNEDRRLAIRTPGGERVVIWGDFIIRGIKGELYLCKPDIFEATYDEIFAGSDDPVEANRPLVEQD